MSLVGATDITNCGPEVIAALYSTHRMFVCETCDGSGEIPIVERILWRGLMPFYRVVGREPCMCCFTFGFHYDYEYCSS